MLWEYIQLCIMLYIQMKLNNGVKTPCFLDKLYNLLTQQQVSTTVVRIIIFGSDPNVEVAELA